MATTTQTAGNQTWVQFALPTESFLLSIVHGNRVTVAATTANSPPTFSFGHVITLDNNGAMTRDLLGDGYAWFKAMPGLGDVEVAITKWVP